METAIPSFTHPLLPKYGGGVEGPVVTIHLGGVRSVSKSGSFPQWLLRSRVRADISL